MKHFRLYFVLFLCFCFSIGHAQEKNPNISAPISIPQTGVNKVLCMKNGNTMLFHFEFGKDIIVKIFDSTHREIANQSIDYRKWDFLGFAFKRLFELNNEAVLFIEQSHYSKKILVRLRFSGNDGRLIEDVIAGESVSMSKPTIFYVIKNTMEDEYSILSSTDDRLFQNYKTNVTFYNNKHEKIKEVPLDIEEKKYDYVDILSAASQPNGILVSLCFGKLLENGTDRGNLSAASIYDHHLAMYYIPKGSSMALYAGAHLSTDTYPFFSNYTYNPFAKTLNLLLLSYRDIAYQFGYVWLPGSIMQHIFFKVDASNMAVDYKWMKYTAANNFLRKKTDSSAAFEGVPMNMYTNDNGLSTVISESISRYTEPETQVRTNYYTYVCNIGITQFDDDGNELWGTVLPLSQRHKSYEGYLSMGAIMNKQDDEARRGDLPEALYERQFVSTNSYNYDKNFYVIFNDNDKNFNNSIEHPGDTVYSFNTTNACYYKMDRKKEITKHYLYGTPEANEYKTSFIKSADFDEQRGIYVSVIQYKKGDDISLRMAWRKLE